MKKLLTTVLFLLTLQASYAQQLSNSQTSGQTIALFKITDREAAGLYLSSLKNASISNGMRKAKVEYLRNTNPSDALLHTFVRSWNADAPTPADIPAGHYLLVRGEGNMLRYEYYPVKNVRLHLIKNMDSYAISLTDKNDRALTTPEVQFRGKQLSLQPEFQTYPLRQSSKKGLVTVKHEGTVNYFYLQPYKRYRLYSNQSWFVRQWRQLQRFFGPKPGKNNYKGYLVTGKPKYKPRDTVRLKAFLTDAKGNPVNIPLQLKLGAVNNREEEDTILQVLHPYRPGAYEYSFVLTDGLDLDLDEDYKLSLGANFKTNRKKEYLHGSFEYEEYELSQLTFNARTEKPAYAPGMPVKFFLKATDENNLPVLDGRVTVTVNTISSSNYATGATFIPKKLWQQEVPLEQTGETVVIVPDSIFPDADLQCSVTCELNSSSNDHKTESFSFSRQKTVTDIRFERVADSIRITCLESGLPAAVPARVIFYNAGKDSIGQAALTLPATIPASPYVARYTAVTGHYRKSYDISSSMAEISFTGYRRHDSIFANLDNPYKIPVWYKIYADKQLIRSGKATQLQWADKAAGSATYSLWMAYVYGDVSAGSGQYVYYLPSTLDVKIHAPETIQPGATARITVAVTDNKEQPVADADVTAYAHTSKFNAGDPEVPYLDRLHVASPKLTPDAGIATREKLVQTGPLNWSRWKTLLGLDTMPFYRFFHPEGLLYNFEPAVHGITQIAPFAVKDGKPQLVQLVWINDQLKYVNGRFTDNTYSFRIMPGKQSIRMVTAEYEIVADSVYAPAGMKTFVSIPVDKPGPGVKVMPRRKPYFTDAEKALLGSKLLLLKPAAVSMPQYVNNNGLIFPFTYSYYSPAIIGPVAPARTYYFGSPLLRQHFTPETGYAYSISKGLIKQEKLNIVDKYFSDKLSGGDDTKFRLGDHVLTATDMDSLYNDQLESVAVTLRQNGDNKALLKCYFPDSVQQQVRQLFLYRYDSTAWVEIERGNSASEIRLTPGFYKMVLLMKHNGFAQMDSLQVKAGHEAIYKYDRLPVQPDTDSIHRLRQRLNMAIITGDYEMEFAIKKPEKRYPDSKPITLNGHQLVKLVKGTVRDADGTPIPFASVMIKGTSIGALTNERGAYALHVTDTGTLLFRAVGYNEAVRPIQSDEIYDVMLFEHADALSEEVVVGYGAQKKAYMSASAIHYERALQGRVAGVSVVSAKRKFFARDGNRVIIRGAAGTESDQQPLLIVDGQPFTGSLSDISEDLISNLELLSTETAVSLYGARAAAGAVIITTTVKGGLKSQEPEAAEGPRLSLRRNFRDDAYWQPRLRTNEKGEVSFDVTFPDDITSWKSYALVAGDHKQSGFATALTRAYTQVSANLALPQFALAGDTLDVLTKIMNYNGDSIRLRRSLTVDGKQLKNGEVALRHSLIETARVAAPAGDSLRNLFAIHHQSLSDGEYRAVPIYPVGTQEAVGQFFQLGGDTTFTLQAGNDTGTVHLYAAASAMPVLLQEAAYLYAYRYDCNEQLASKLIAALLQKRWAAALDTNIHINEHIRNMVNRLEKARNMDGLWGWWSNGPTSGWISAHVLKALHMAADAGFRTKTANKDLTRFLAPRVDQYGVDTRMDFLGWLRDTDSTFNLRAYVDTISTRHLSPIQQLRLMELKQRAGVTVNTETLRGAVKRTLFGNTWWGPDSLDIYNSRIQYTLLAYRILRNEGGHDALLRSTRAWLLDQRGPNCWRNTYESATIMATIGDDIFREQEQQLPALQVNNTRVTKFPYEATFPAGQPLQISKTGRRMLYLGAWQRRFNASPNRVDSAFKVRTAFKADNNVITTLTAGKKVELEARVEVREDAQFVMIEIPIPAGCSYNGKPQPSGNGEVHREYFYEKVSIFCQYLGKGEYTFTIPLMPRYTGSFQLNPARAELMYFPVFYGRERVKRVPIK
ncbi:carboxypeptidase-like regulatory domain-containing protein [Chitinophaga sp. CB10]|uniref:carboxypeptidase-like regulatory domain-containing protein n=1 Tax=Chitinophaga sp. CB10 TaxID=1891659 RepID=UPI0025BD7ABA|nr:carboxypeptidase-like regulatory domain-containing protein [Chitinophaga sp. CB10]